MNGDEDEIWCFDLHGTLDSDPSRLGAVMRGLRAQGTKVHILTGEASDTPSQAKLDADVALLESLGLGDCWDRIALVAQPDNRVADLKASYMRHVGASVLVDNLKENVSAARKAGFTAMRFQGGKEKP
jgi:hypothetical protein